jgi:hypothetical protein
MAFMRDSLVLAAVSNAGGANLVVRDERLPLLGAYVDPDTRESVATVYEKDGQPPSRCTRGTRRGLMCFTWADEQARCGVSGYRPERGRTLRSRDGGVHFRHLVEAGDMQDNIPTTPIRLDGLPSPSPRDPGADWTLLEQRMRTAWRLHNSRIAGCASMVAWGT